MRLRRTGIALAVSMQLLGLAVVVPTAAAQDLDPMAAVVPGERLSDWLLRNAGPNADVTALHWRVQAERLAQGRLRDAVLQSLDSAHASALSAETRGRLSEWLRGMPLTGRLTLLMGDARWLQSAPGQDPVLGIGDSVVLPQRPRAVAVVTEAGQICLATHRPGALPLDYVRACRGGDGAAQVDRVWVAQPDGRTADYGVAPWSLEAQLEPGPGAWIWAPGREAAIAPSVSDNLTRFLATQLPAEELGSEPQPMVAVPRVDTVAPRPARLTASDWGEIGVLQTPSARMAPAGEVRLQINHVAPYTRGTLMLQPLDLSLIHI